MRTQNPNLKSDPQNGCGFSLVELLVVIATIAILAAMLLPAVGGTKPDGRAVQCLNNLHRLSLAWQMYAADNNEIMLPNAPIGLPSQETWCGSQGENWTVSQGNTNVSQYANSLAGAYLDHQVSPFRCPADSVPSANGIRLRSYSMNGQMGNFYLRNLTTTYNVNYIAFVKVTELTKLSPANAFVFCEENMCSLNDGYLQVASNTAQFPDVPGSYHHWSGGFDFADGHAAMHGWVTPSLKIPAVFGYTTFNVPANPGGANNPDWVWFTQHATVHQ